MSEQIKEFFATSAFAVAGASKDRSKYGNKVLRCYIQQGKKVYPVNPNHSHIEGIQCLKRIDELPGIVESLSIITPPNITEKIVNAAIKKGIKNIWMQPGAENDDAIKACLENKINVIAKGPCILVLLGFSEKD